MNVGYWMGRADRALATAPIVAANGDPTGACSNAYHAMFYAPRAELLEVGQAERAMEMTHSGMVSASNQYLIRPGPLDRKFSDAFGLELDRRIIADYAEGGVGATRERESILSVQNFVKAAKDAIMRLRQPSTKGEGS